MSDDKKNMDEENDELRQLEKKAEAYDVTLKELHKTIKLLKSERSGRESECEKAKSDINKLQQNLTDERSEHQIDRDETSELIDDMEREKAERIRFFTIISHDLRTPITSLTGFLSIMISRFEDLNPEQIKDYLLRLQANVYRLSHLTESLLTWTKHKLGKFQSEFRDIDLKELTDENVELFSESCAQKEISLINNLNESIMIYADYDMIDAAVRNILSNAVKFTHKKGTIQISAESKEDVVILSVTDDGMGIPKNRLQTLFNPSPNRTLSSPGTAGEKGTGLGLFICKEMIEKNNGTLWLESKEGFGTTVFIKLQLFAVDVEDH